LEFDQLTFISSKEAELGKAILKKNQKGIDFSYEILYKSIYTATMKYL
jgi:hypothetical protein